MNFQAEYQNILRKFMVLQREYNALLEHAQVLIMANQKLPITSKKWTELCILELEKITTFGTDYSEEQVIRASLAVARSLGMIDDSVKAPEVIPDQVKLDGRGDPIIGLAPETESLQEGFNSSPMRNHD